MPPKQRVQSSGTAPTASTPTAARSTRSSASTNADAQDIVHGVWSKYIQKTPQRTKLLDTFMAFLVGVGALQFLYVVLVGNFPFNAFLSGFSATVGQFVLTVSLRMQTNPENKADFESISHERSFADFVLGSLLLHFFCVNFIN
ncbi:defender against death DAD protein [Cucurbitaria berberidis CBS 394.84]|uniref:Dolichyl-diphosphooligosaccharide--protein glycosyltransferase subunit OST2 n=1 Tax=Cucurbitaria berberidis CBS 394.84 TaxID=1168544 RepID=A0A9P4L3P5_9PLEO|nr:defender against death DAD protein [Cucurbitaria berberidis CBS 394.84]KAF1840605.1 defender against death DAD protein [Cucurbitaria berberidis CBS 394.84]